MTIAWEMLAEGIVQGVGFRWFVRDCAAKYRIRGFAKNLPDGNVQIHAQGDESNLQLFADRVKRGTYYVRVDKLTIDVVENYTEYKDFFIA